MALEISATVFDTLSDLSLRANNALVGVDDRHMPDLVFLHWALTSFDILLAAACHGIWDMNFSIALILGFRPFAITEQHIRSVIMPNSLRES